MSKLSSEEREIAARCIVWHMNYIDIGVIVHMAHCRHAQLMKHTAEVRAMLDMYE